MKIADLQIQPVSLLDRQGRQLVVLSYISDQAGHVRLSVIDHAGGQPLFSGLDVPLPGGSAKQVVRVPEKGSGRLTDWYLTDGNGAEIARTQFRWQKPRKITFYMMTSSHTDIGLHNPQYFQRFNSSRFLDMARHLCDKTQDREEQGRYHYMVEGTWFFENYFRDRPEKQARELVEKYVKTGKIGVCAGVAGNHTQMYGLEELCRSAYERSRIKAQYGVDTHTMTMIDNNGISPSLIAPYAEAGYRNVIFAPNQWNPHDSTICPMDRSVQGTRWNPQAQGGGSRIDIRYSSDLPMLFYWKDPASSRRLLVWGSTQYGYGGGQWGVYPESRPSETTILSMEQSIAAHLPAFEEKVPYDVWLFEAYWDDMEPNLRLADLCALWSEKWAWPRFQLLGDPDLPFDLVRERFDSQIPTLEGDITGGWYQHPLSTPELVSKKFSIDRRLAEAEKMNVLAGLADPSCKYPAGAFRSAWNDLLYHDEHSYGTSGYEGKRVYETWMQHNDWLRKADRTAREQTSRALSVLAEKLLPEGTEKAVFAFSAASTERTEYLEDQKGRYPLVKIPAMGYCVVPQNALKEPSEKVLTPSLPPVVENPYYRIVFSSSGGIRSLYDKELDRELLDASAPYAANEPVYTRDNHRTFQVPAAASFEVRQGPDRTVVTSLNPGSLAGADIRRTVTIWSFRKRIDMEDVLVHARDFYNNCRYDRYLYMAFPFQVPGAKRMVQLNGTLAEYGKTVTGHGTDVYMAANEWCCVENKDFGAALFLPDSTLVEFSRIHPDKTDFGAPGEGSALYNYLANDWLQMHAYGSDYFTFVFRYGITSYACSDGIPSWESASLARQAELFWEPLLTKEVQTDVSRAGETASLLKTGTGMRLIGLKRAEDGKGVVARLYGKHETPSFESPLADLSQASQETSDENGRLLPAAGISSSGPDETVCRDSTPVPFGFFTFRLGEDTIRLATQEPEQKDEKQIGSSDTGLITGPVAARGEDQGHLYLMWGQSAWKNLSHYELYRGETPDFVCDADSFVMLVPPGPYVVVSAEERGLKDYTVYYHRVRAVSVSGEKGPFSEVFSGITKETLPD